MVSKATGEPDVCDVMNTYTLWNSSEGSGDVSTNDSKRVRTKRLVGWGDIENEEFESRLDDGSEVWAVFDKGALLISYPQ